MKIFKQLGGTVLAAALALGLAPGAAKGADEAKATPLICNRTIKAEVVAIDQPWMWNRLGAAQPGGVLYALYGDIVQLDGKELPDLSKLSPQQVEEQLAGRVRLRDDKRPRPLVLRANKGDCLEITLWNLLAPDPGSNGGEKATERWALRQKRLQHEPVPESADQSATRWVGIHATGIELIGNISSDSSWIGRNPDSLASTAGAKAAGGNVPPGQMQKYRWYAAEEGTYLIYSPADMESGDQARAGLFGAINVEPEGAEWYRSQVTHDDLEQATLREGDLNTHYRTLESPAVVEKPIAAHVPGPVAGMKNKVLLNREPDKQKAVDVLEATDGRIFTADGQPLIYYQSVFQPGSKRPYRDGLPVLSMLAAKSVGKPLYDEPLKEQPSGYVKELQDLDAGIIPQALKDIFAGKLHIDLSDAAKVVEQYRLSWLITDKGNAYLVSGKSVNNVNRLLISQAELDLISSDLTAVITGPDAGRFSYGNNSPTFATNPASPDRRQPYREYTIIYHQAFFATQAFPQWQNDNLQTVLQAGGDNFAINYGSAAIGPEIVANRIGVGPMGNVDAVDLKFEEFFLSSWAVGDPAMVVDVPANAPNALVSNPGVLPQVRQQVPPGSPAAILAAQTGDPRPAQVIPPQAYDFAPLTGAKATKAFFPDDPSNVYHSYMNDHVKFRILHAGAGPSHVHHLHAHQWLHSPDSDDGHYLDSQLIIPGSAYTLEITYGGSGNRNKTVGDSIFHCHFYPHFAQGMWALWRVHDVFEAGTVLDANGVPIAGVNRALPDGEIARGTPIPALVPLPTLAMAPTPAKVELTNMEPWAPGGDGRRVKVIPEKVSPKLDAQGQIVKDSSGNPVTVPVFRNPGYPFFIPGVSGHRSPHPPLGFAWLEDPNTGAPILNPQTHDKFYLDGGLPRHLVLGGKILEEYQTRWDFTKEFVERDKSGKLHGDLDAYELPEDGTPIEKVAMQTHATRTRPSSLPNGDPGNFTLNGLPPTPGAPYADPSVTDFGDTNIHRRRYQAAVIELNAVLNKTGWHFPQQRMISLWQDVKDVYAGDRPPEPLFFRSNTQDTIQFWHTNLVPNYYELDDFQVRTPTDIIGQHIHLVKFDVTSSDGASNGFNYEAGTFSPEEVQGRIAAIDDSGGLFSFDPANDFVNKEGPRLQLQTKKVKDYYPAPGDQVDVSSGQPVVTRNGKPVEFSVFGKSPKPGEWDGAQTTIELWGVDPLLNNEGEDRTLRTVFTHDHFSASTHQQAGIYAGLVVEPESSLWYLPDGTRMNTRLDGGPTSWHGYIIPSDPKESYREFMLEFQDMQLAYTKDSLKEPSSAIFDPRKDPSAPAAFDLNQSPLPPTQDVDGQKRQLTSGAMAYYVGQLNAAKLPVAKNPLVPAFPDLFLDFGVPLSAKATVTVTKKDEEWVITEAAGEKNAGAEYIIQAKRQEVTIQGQKVPIITSMPVFMPNITPGWSDSKFALNSPPDSNNTANGAPFPQLVSQNQVGTYSVNYRNDPVPFRVADIKGGTATPKAGDAGDLSLAFASIKRGGDGVLDIQPDGKTPGFPKSPLVPNAQPYDPYTPLIEAYANDKVQIRSLVGAHTQSHAYEIHGIKWLFEPSSKNSGYRNAQLMGLSEHFEMLFKLPATTVDHPTPGGPAGTPQSFADYFYSPSSDIVGLNNGAWGIMRAYGSVVSGVQPLPNNPKPVSPGNVDIYQEGYTAAKAGGGAVREFDITAVDAASALPGGNLVFNNRQGLPAPLQTANGLLFVRTSDLDNGKLKANAPIEPLIIRAAAGEWIKVTLRNGFNTQSPVFQPANAVPNELPYATPFKGTTQSPSTLPMVPLNTSTNIGLHAQLVGYDPASANGLVVGFNPKNQLVAPGKSQDFYWYAGDVKTDETGKKIVATTPIEFGATNLISGDQLIHPQFGLVGALIVEPQGSTWVEDVTSRASATVTNADGIKFRDFVVVDQNMVANSSLSADSAGNPNPLNTVAGNVVGAVNFRSEPFSIRPLPNNAQNLPQPTAQGFSQAFSDSLYNPASDPQTPVFVAPAGSPTRIRLLVPSTTTNNEIVAPPVFIVHGHNWEEEPYVHGSTKIGNNPRSEHFGAIQAGPNQKFDLVFKSAGGTDRVAGDYLYTTYQTAGVLGTWGLFRVTNQEVVIEKASINGGSLTAQGSIRFVTQNGTDTLPKQLHVYGSDASNPNIDLGVVNVATDGTWSMQATTTLKAPVTIQASTVLDQGTGATTSKTIEVTATGVETTSISN